MNDEYPKVWWSDDEIRRWSQTHCCPLPINMVELGGAALPEISSVAEIHWELKGCPVRRRVCREMRWIKDE
jgi:hypothetical protein